MRTLLPFATVLVLLYVSPSLCQIARKKSDTRPAGSTDTNQIHQVFFSRVAKSNPRNPFTFSSDLTDSEMVILNRVAADCQSGLQPLDDGPVVLEARMRFVESGEQQADWLNPRLARLKTQRDDMVVKHVEELRAALGDERFQALETAIHDWYNSLLAFPASNARATPTRKK